MISKLITAIKTLTVIPVPGKECTHLSDSLVFFPLVGILLSVATFTLAVIMQFAKPELHFLSGMVVTLFLTLITGGLHLDGIADVSDGFGGGQNKTSILEIMKDPRQGTYGVTAIVFVLLLRIEAYTLVTDSAQNWFLFMGPFVGRTIQVVACSFFRYARNSNGKAVPFVKAHTITIVVVGGMLVLWIGILLLFGYVSGVTASAAGISGSLLFLLYCNYRIGGVTGDCIGASSEIAEIVYIYTGIILLRSV